MDEAAVLGPGEGERISDRLVIKMGRPEIVVTESDYEPGGRGPDPHVHRHHVDSFWILEGRLAFGLGADGDEAEAGADSFALVPPEVVHTFRNPGPGPARFLNFHAPGMGFETYLRSGYEIPYDQHDPPADGGRSPSEVIVRPPGDGSVKAGGNDALGSLAVAEVVVEPGFEGAGLHSHTETVDSFYVLEGVLTVHFGGKKLDAPAGSYAIVPPGNDHAVSNPRNEPVRMLNVMAPGGLEHDLPAV